MGDNIFFAFLLTLGAGLATGIGGAMVLLTKQTDKKFLSFALGLSSGVMIYVSFVEILPKSVENLSNYYAVKNSNIYSVISFFIGIILIWLVNKLIPKYESHYKVYDLENDTTENKSTTKLMRIGIFTAIAIAIHNFPEGMATFISAIDNSEMGIAITFAIAIHNIPEGIAVAVPVFYATGKKHKAFLLSLFSGLTEPLGAVIGYFFFIKLIGAEAFGFIFAGVAGMMVYISFDELLPAAKEYGEEKFSITGLFTGMLIMAISLILFI